MSPSDPQGHAPTEILFDQGYQHWRGRTSGFATRWAVIADQSIRAQLRNRWLVFLLLLSMIPAILLIVILVLFALLEQQVGLIQSFVILFIPIVRDLQGSFSEVRLPFWTVIFGIFFWLQTFLAMFIVLVVGSNQVSKDLRFNAIPLYLSRPLSRPSYFLGKFAAIGLFVGGVMVVPLVTAYVLGVLLSFDVEVIAQTASLFGASLLYSLIVVLVLGLTMLALSSLNRNVRVVGVLWLVLWFVGSASSNILSNQNVAYAPLISLTGNLSHLRLTLIDSEGAIEDGQQVISDVSSRNQPTGFLFGGGPPPGSRPEGMSGRSRRRGPFFGPPRDRGQDDGPNESTDDPDDEGEEEDEENNWFWRENVVDPSYSAIVLGGVLLGSVLILSARVKSLDRLK